MGRYALAERPYRPWLFPRRFAVKLSKGEKPTEDNLRKYIAQADRP
jgi:hypothetical protein